MWRRAVRYKPDVSEERTAPIFRVKDVLGKTHDSGLPFADYLFGILFDREDRSCTLLRNVV
jgi:hypothetical protein